MRRTHRYHADTLPTTASYRKFQDAARLGVSRVLPCPEAALAAIAESFAAAAATGMQS